MKLLDNVTSTKGTTVCNHQVTKTLPTRVNPANTNKEVNMVIYKWFKSVCGEGCIQKVLGQLMHALRYFDPEVNIQIHS